MPLYRLYRLHADNSIIDRLDVDAPDDNAAIDEAIRIDHATIIEIWCEARLVSRVAPNKEIAGDGEAEPRSGPSERTM